MRRSLSGFIAALLISSALCSRANAATVALVPNGNGTNNSWSVTSGNKWDAVIDSEGDCATSYTSITETTVGEVQGFSLNDPSVSAATYDSVQVYFETDRVGAASGAILRVRLRLSGSTTNGTSRTIGTSNCAAWGPETLARPGGGSWSASDWNNLEVEVEYVSTVSGTPTMHVITLTVTGYYTPPAASITGKWLYNNGVRPATIDGLGVKYLEYPQP